MTNKRAVVLPCRGIGDALLMMIVSERLRREGLEVTTIHPALVELQSWFPGHRFAKDWDFSPDDWVIVENDNSDRIESLKKQFRRNLTIFYPTYSFQKHGLLSPLDRVFDAKKPMAENIAEAISTFYNASEVSKENGLVPPGDYLHRMHRQRVLIHHTSSADEKNWLREKFEEVSRGLDRRGFEPVFVPEFDSLSELAAYVYESGFAIGNDSLIGHLASNMNIPTLIIADKADRMQLWRPAWLHGEVVTLPDWLPRWKFFEKNWQYFISSARVLKAFDQISETY